MQPYHVQQLDAQMSCSDLTALCSLLLGSCGSLQSLSIFAGLLPQGGQLLPQMLHLCRLLIACSLKVLTQWGIGEITTGVAACRSDNSETDYSSHGNKIHQFTKYIMIIQVLDNKR